MTKKQFHQLMETYLNGTSSPEEDYYLFKWYDSMQEYNTEGKTVPVEEEEALFLKIQSQILTGGLDLENKQFETKLSQHDLPRTNRFFQTKVAASVALISGLLAGLHFYDRHQSADEMKVENIKTTSSQKRRSTLPDGTLVWLNVNSKLTYLSTFNHTQREVWLDGEAYFEVNHNAIKPFVVHTADLTVKDLGTKFNLKAYPHHQTETSLIQGSVEVTLNGKNKNKVTLQPYQKLVLEQHAAATLTLDAHLENISPQEDGKLIAEIDWIHQEFSFTDARFEDILPALKKRFGVQLIIQNQKVKDYRFTGSFKDAGINTVLNALQFSNEFRYRKEGKQTIIIY